MYIYHYSSINIKDKIEVKHFGKNSYSQHSRNISAIKRSFFYLDKIKKESYFFGSKFLYTVIISKDKIYSIDNDILGIFENNSGNVSECLRLIKKAGYIGFSGSNGIKNVCLLVDITFINKEILN